MIQTCSPMIGEFFFLHHDGSINWERSVIMAVFTLETDNPCGQIIRLVHFPSWCEFETDNCWVFPSRIHIRRIDCTVFFSQARLQFRRGYNSTIFNMASMVYAMFSFPELNALFLVPGFSWQNQTSLSVLMWIQDGSSVSSDDPSSKSVYLDGFSDG